MQNDNEIQIYTQPIILNGRTLVPVRAITEAFGANVNWDGSTQTVIITGDTSGQRKSDEEIKRVDEFDAILRKESTMYFTPMSGLDMTVKENIILFRFQIMERKTVTRAVLKYILTER